MLQTGKNPKLAIIVPCFNEEEILKQSAVVLSDLLNSLIIKRKISSSSFICFVDDGSHDLTWQIIKELSANESKIQGIRLACNMGHQVALYSGICENNADIYITIDCDLQDDVNVTEEMIDKYLTQDIDVVYGVRSSRKSDTFLKGFTANLYYFLIGILGNKSIKNHADFRLMSDNVAKIIRNTCSSNIYLRGFIYSLGLKYDKVFYERKKRMGGEAKYTFLKLAKLAMDGFIELSQLPVYVILFCSFIYLFISLIKLSLISFFFSLNFFFLSILCIYITRIYKELKTKKKYVICEKTNGN